MMFEKNRYLRPDKLLHPWTFTWNHQDMQMEKMMEYLIIQCGVDVSSIGPIGSIGFFKPKQIGICLGTITACPAKRWAVEPGLHGMATGFVARTAWIGWVVLPRIVPYVYLALVAILVGQAVAPRLLEIGYSAWECCHHDALTGDISSLYILYVQASWYVYLQARLTNKCICVYLYDTVYIYIYYIYMCIINIDR